MSETEVENGLVDVVVLDDDLDFRNYIEDLLRDEGKYSIRSFADASTLFESIQDSVPEIVLLDMKMGATSGETVVEDLLAQWPELCIIVITGYPSLESMRTTFKLRVFDYLAKPFSIQQLRQTLQNAIEQFGLGSTPQERLRKRLGHCIKLLRVERNWSLKELATAAKLSVSQISSIERGTNLPSVESLLAISRAFNRRPSELLASIDF
ncbi:MAG: response regulator [Bryobacteraceae bacterium]